LESCKKKDKLEEEALLDGSLHLIVIIFVRRSPGMLFVISGCHAFLSSPVVTLPCHFDRRAGNRQNLIKTGQSF
jgi:hypothetical protein